MRTNNKTVSSYQNHPNQIQKEKNMKKKLLPLLCIVPILASANEYQTNVQVFTSNTAGKPCTTTPQMVYKGNRFNYAEHMSKTGDAAVYGALFSLLGLGVGAAVFGIGATSEALVGDNEYLYVTECNSGADKTRLMTLVVSNNKMSEAQWLPLAQKDQTRGK